MLSSAVLRIYSFNMPIGCGLLDEHLLRTKLGLVRATSSAPRPATSSFTLLEEQATNQVSAGFAKKKNNQPQRKKGLHLSECFTKSLLETVALSGQAAVCRKVGPGG